MTLTNLLYQNFTINYWIEEGASPAKLVMGMPLYGQSFSLDKAKVRFAQVSIKTYLYQHNVSTIPYNQKHDNLTLLNIWNVKKIKPL